MTLSEELRQLARDIEELVRKSPCYSMAWAPTTMLSDFLTMRALVIELQLQDQQKAEDGA